MQLSVSTFLETVERSGLVERSQLARTLSDLERDSGAEAANDSLVVANHLGRVGLITDWQRKRLLEGRAAGFFLGKYRLLDHLGTGGMSSVFLAEHPLMRRRVAIKVLPKNRVNDSSYLARFHREARAVASLDHPNIVRAFDVDNDGDVHYLVMEYIEGHDLKSVVDRDGPLSYRTAADYMRQAADGLAHAHEAGLVHRDVKPANLLIDAKQVVKLLDMGLARTSDEIDASLTKDHDERMLGTVDYLAPEQALDSHLVDPRADLYSLGCTLYFALTGHPPFPDGTLAQRILMHQTKEPADIALKRPDVPASLVAICRRMMAKSPSGRYQSATEASQALVEWIGRFDRGETRPTPAKSDSAEELTLAPLDDEPHGRVAPTPRPTSAANEASESIKSDNTKVDRGTAGKTTVAGKLPVAKPIGSSIKGPPKSPGGSSVKSPGGQTKRTPGSSIKASAGKGSPSKVVPAGGAAPKAPGSSIKASPGRQGPADQPAAAAALSPEIGLPTTPEPLLGPLSGDGLLDDLLSGGLAGGPLLSDGATLSGTASGQSHLLGGKPVPVTKKGRRSRWDSTWFLIFVGTLLGLFLVALFVAWHLFS